MDSYWNGVLRKRISRRRALATSGGGLAAAAFLAACGSDDDSDNGGDSGSGSTSPTPDSSGAVDSTQGNQGGKLVFQQFGDPGGLVLVQTANAGVQQLASLTHSGLLAMANGRPGIGVGPSDITPEPDLAAALPEQPADGLTYVVKIEQGVKFQNGREVTADDVVYSFRRYAFDDDSAYKGTYSWLESVEATDPTTVVFKTKAPYADMVGSLTARDSGLILAQEHEESAEAATKLMGSGPYTFVERQEPIVSRFKRDPNYFRQPYPYFDEIEMLGTSDSAKRVADMISGQTHVTYWFAEEERDQIKSARPEAVLWGHQAPAFAIQPTVDIAPFDDIRVRQAMSMSINRQQLSEAVSKGAGEPDNAFTWTVATWGFSKPADLPGDLSRYYEFNPAEAKKLLSAANLPNGFDSAIFHWDATVIGQGLVDTATLLETVWKNEGIGNVEDKVIAFADYTATVKKGDFVGMYLGPGGGAGFSSQTPGSSLQNLLWSPPEGPVVPSGNLGHVADPTLNTLIEKQNQQIDPAERKATFTEMELLMAEQQYRIPINTVTNNYFSAPELRNIQIPVFHVNYSAHYVKYWWFA